MSDEGKLRLEKLASRYELPGQEQWQTLLNHFEYSKGFSLLVLLVLDVDASELCRRELERQLQQEGKQLFAIELPTPEDLRRLPSSLLETQPPSDAGCVWIAGVEPDYGKAYPAWRDAWQFMLARLNPYRNNIRRHFNLPLVFVGAPWLQEVMREIAPDLWSVRSLVVRVEPVPSDGATKLTSQLPSFEIDNEISSADPIFALNEAERLRGKPGKELALARLLSRAGQGFASRQNWSSAQKAYLEALELNQRAKAPPDLLIDNLNELAVARVITGHFQESISYLERALRISREIGDRRREGNALGNLGVIYADLGQPRKAIEHQEQALLIAHQTCHRRAEARFLGNLGIAYADLGQPRKAIELYEQSLLIARELGDKHTEGSAVGNLGLSYMNLGDFRKGIEFCENALAITRENGDRRNEGNALGNLGFAYASLAEPLKAIEFYNKALAIALEIGDRRGENVSLANLGDVYMSYGDPLQAKEFYGKALPIAREIGDRTVEGSVLFGCALASHTLNNRTQAIAYAEAALQILKEIESPMGPKVEALLARWRSGFK
jgi:tetratricopeptide (TPR) repeat protein